MPIKLSYSKISTFIECPRKFFLSYICNLGTGSSPYMSNGTAIHKCCEDFVDWPEEKQTLDNLIAYYFEILPGIDTKNLVHESFEDVTEDGEIIVQYVINPLFEKKAIDSLKSFYEDFTENYYQQVTTGRYAFHGPNRETTKPKVILQEQWFNIVTKDGHEVRGLIDRVDEEIGGEHIVDYKSGQSRITYKALQDPLDIKAMQLSIYALARYKQTGKIPVKTSLFYLEPKKDKKEQKGQYYTAPQRSEEDLEKLENFLNDIGNEIESLLDKKDFPIGDSPQCFWCDFKDRCDILSEQEILKLDNPANPDNPNWD